MCRGTASQRGLPIFAAHLVRAGRCLDPRALEQCARVGGLGARHPRSTGHAPRARTGTPVGVPVAWDALDDLVPGTPTVRTAAAVVGDGDPWRAALPAPQAVPAALVAEGHEIPPPRVAAMHEGRRRAREAGRS